MKPTRLSLSLAALLAGCASGSRAPVGSQSATIEGTVASSSSALTVNVPGSASSSLVDSSGAFVLIGVPPGTTSLHFKGGSDDATLEIEQLVETEHRKLSVSVSGHSATEHHEQTASGFHGLIEALTAPNLTVSGRLIVTSSATVLSRGAAAIGFDGLKLGDRVEIEGALQADGSVIARLVHVEVEDGHGAADGGASDGGSAAADAHFEGTLTARDGALLTVSGIAVTLTSATVIEKHDAHIAASDLQINDHLLVEGTAQGEHAFLAREIHVLSIVAGDVTIHVTGALAAVSEHALKIGETSVALDASTTYGGDGLTGFAGLKVSDPLDVEAVRHADGSLVAKSVHRLALAPPPAGTEVELAGTLENLGQDGLTVSGHRFAFDHATVFKRGSAVIAAADLHVGNLVQVKGNTRASGLPPLATQVTAQQ